MPRLTQGERIAVLEQKSARDDEIGREHHQIFERLRAIESDLAVIQSRGNGRLRSYAGQGAFLSAMVLALQGVIQYVTA